MKRLLPLLLLIAIVIFNACSDCTNTVCQYGFCTNGECEPWQTDFLGIYSGNITCDASEESHVSSITAGATDSKLVIDSLISATIVSSTSFEIPSQEVNFQGQPATISGNGTVTTNGLFLYTSIDQGGTVTTCVFRGS